ncbi:MAG: histidinol-phosphate transaminase [Flavobacteriales bacterium]|nr:histidinol-phosphate transaminase [Flavobacteriales bacterium]
MKFSINDILRPNIASLAPYSCARDEYDGDDAIFLDANENPYDTGYNRYPDPMQRLLKKRISVIKGVDEDMILLGNGSDEIIDIIIRSVCRPSGIDNIVTFIPGYSMYDVSAHINDVELRSISLTTSFMPDWEEYERVADENTKITFICTPHNPIGVAVPLKDIEELCGKTRGIVVVDEAYIDFSSEGTAVSLLDKYPNVIVLQTLSKAWGMAGLRLGMCFASREIISVLNKVKPPYNISSQTQKIALSLLCDVETFQERKNEILRERERLLVELRKMSIFTHVYASQGNFILVRTACCDELYRYLVDGGIVVRKRDIPPLIGGGIRITVGTPQENDLLIDLLTKYNTHIG